MTWTLPAESRLIKEWRAGLSNAEIREILYTEGLGEFTARAISAKGRRLGLGKRGPGGVNMTQVKMSASPYRTCQFPLWPDDGKVTREFCGAPTYGRLSYCEVHAERCFGSPVWRHEA